MSVASRAPPASTAIHGVDGSMTPRGPGQRPGPAQHFSYSAAGQVVTMAPPLTPPRDQGIGPGPPVGGRQWLILVDHVVISR